MTYDANELPLKMAPMNTNHSFQFFLHVYNTRLIVTSPYFDDPMLNNIFGDPENNRIFEPFLSSVHEYMNLQLPNKDLHYYNDNVSYDNDDVLQTSSAVHRYFEKAFIRYSCFFKKMWRKLLYSVILPLFQSREGIHSTSVLDILLVKTGGNDLRRILEKWKTYSENKCSQERKRKRHKVSAFCAFLDEVSQTPTVGGGPVFLPYRIALSVLSNSFKPRLEEGPRKGNFCSSHHLVTKHLLERRI